MQHNQTLKTLDGIAPLVMATNYYKSKLKKTDKEILLDKVNIVTNSIIKGNRKNWLLPYFEPVPLSTDILQEQLGRNYKQILSLLIDLKLVETDNRYLTTSTANKLSKTHGKDIAPKSKSYGFTSKAKAMQIVKTGIITNRVIKKILVAKSNDLNKYLKDKDVHNKIINNLTQLTFTIDSLKDALRIANVHEPQELKHREDCFNGLQELNTITTVKGLKSSNSFFYNAENKTGRVYNYYNNIPKEYRKHLRHQDGTQLVEIDLKNSQPLLLTLLLFEAVTGQANDTINTNTNTSKNVSIIRWFEANKKAIIKEIAPTKTDYNDLLKELDGLIENVSTGKFYEQLRYAAILQDLPAEMDYKVLKMSVLKCIFSYANTELSEMERVINYRYPYLLKFMRYIKLNRNHKEVSHLAQIYESSIFIDKTFNNLDNNTFAIPLHDSIICKVQDLDKIKTLVNNAITETFRLNATTTSKLLTTTYYA
ncbi:hypothetical protein [Nonlabens sp. Asnod3-A02]|uniref:hypothetical protein n=1 Tax=Nonlabens sp. Asnod3-A02 TaxID=3160579 RepID=UPI00386CB493